ncbi:hypothetical protein ACF0H5_021434 [Mactra antiquata]
MSNTVTQATADNISAKQAEESLGAGPGVSGGPGIQQVFSREEDGGHSETVTFSRTYIHFIGPGIEYSGGTVEPNFERKETFSYDFGASIIPFNYTKAACRPAHLIKYLPRCNSYRILGHTATMTDLIVSRDEIQADGRIVTTPQQDCIEVFIDTNGKFRPENIVALQGSLFDVNCQFRKVEPSNIQEGTIPRCKIHFPPEMYTSTRNEILNDYSMRAFDPYNGLFTIDHWNTGSTYKLEHHFDSGRIPVASFANIDKAYCNELHRKTANYILDTVWGIQANMATQVNRSPILPPKYRLFRFAPFYTANGKQNRTGQFKCTYTTTIQFYYSPHCGIDMFMAGDQYLRMHTPADDPYDNTAADLKRFNFGVHEENFVIPQTKYIMKPDTEESSLITRDFDTAKIYKELIESQRKLQTTQQRIDEALVRNGYKLVPKTVKFKTGQDPSDVLTHETETLVHGDLAQLQPENEADFGTFEPKNLTQLDPAIAEALFNPDFEPKEAIEFAKQKLGDIYKDNPDILDKPLSQSVDMTQNKLIGTDRNLNLIGTDKGPLMPFTATALPMQSVDDVELVRAGDEDDEKIFNDVDIVNTPMYSRNEIWKLIGVSKPPSWTRTTRARGTYKYTPWPQLRSEGFNYGTVVTVNGKQYAKVWDLDMVKALNKNTDRAMQMEG